MKQDLTIDTIGDVDQGALRVAVNNAFRLLTKDLTDRPALSKPRKVILEVVMKPVIDTNSNHAVLESVDTSWQVMTKSPAIGSSGVVMKTTHDGQLYFHSDLPQDPDDETIIDEAERRRREREQDRRDRE